MKNLQNKFYDLHEEVMMDLLSKKPFNLKDLIREDYEDEDDMLLDLPYSFTTDKNGFYMIHMVVTEMNESGDFICVGTGEDFGEPFIQSIDEVPVESLFQISSMLE